MEDYANPQSKVNLRVLNYSCSFDILILWDNFLSPAGPTSAPPMHRHKLYTETHTRQRSTLSNLHFHLTLRPLQCVWRFGTTFPPPFTRLPLSHLRPGVSLIVILFTSLLLIALQHSLCIKTCTGWTSQEVSWSKCSDVRFTLPFIRMGESLCVSKSGSRFVVIRQFVKNALNT